MQLHARWLASLIALLLLGLGSLRATTLTTPPEALNGLRPGTLTLDALQAKFGTPSTNKKGNLLGLYGGTTDSSLFGWFMVQNPSYTVPDLAVETAKGSTHVDLVMSLGYAGLKTKKGLACFATESTLTQTYGKPDFVFSVPMNSYTLREFYYVDQGISFDVAPINQNGDRQVIAIYVTYPEYLRTAIQLRKKYIEQGTGKDITGSYMGESA